MLDLFAELRRVIEALDAAGVPYALVGGLAVSIYATPRATEDIDLLIAPDDLPKTTAALQGIGFRSAGRPMRVAAGRLEIQRLTRIDGADLLPLDLLMPLDPELARAVSDRTAPTLEGRRLSVIGLAGLRALKRLRGSTQDRADLEALGEE